VTFGPIEASPDHSPRGHHSTMSEYRSYPPHQLGVWGEQLAAQRLSLLGWTILRKNYQLGRREIDLIMARRGVLAFVEVKTRSGGRFGPPEAAVTSRKRREIEAVARDFLMRYRGPLADVRFDVVAIVVGPARRLVRYDHIEDAWRPSEG
jgi:putative endonuclease